MTLVDLLNIYRDRLRAFAYSQIIHGNRLQSMLARRDVSPGKPKRLCSNVCGTAKEDTVVVEIYPPDQSIAVRTQSEEVCQTSKNQQLRVSSVLNGS